MAKRYVMVIDLRRCVGCQACTIACQQENNVHITAFRAWVKQVEKGTYPNVRKLSLPVLCNQCERPICVQNCPVQATYQRDDGIVLIDYDRCIGCKYCIASCPYDVRFVNPVRKVVEKCTFCAHRVDRGDQPACVETCMPKARIFGDLNDPESEVARIIDTTPVVVLKPDVGTNPRVFYVFPDQFLMETHGTDAEYVRYYHRRMNEEISLSEEDIKERHKILAGVSRADRFYDYRIDSNRPIR